MGVVVLLTYMGDTIQDDTVCMVMLIYPIVCSFRVRIVRM